MRPVKIICLLSAFISALAVISHAESKKEKQPIELGTVKWSRDLDSSLASAKKSGKPVLLLFQEVPG